MSDIVERLKREGAGAFEKHYSLGMWKLCADAADEIERLRAVVAKYEAEHTQISAEGAASATLNNSTEEK